MSICWTFHYTFGNTAAKVELSLAPSKVQDRPSRRLFLESLSLLPSCLERRDFRRWGILDGDSKVQALESDDGFFPKNYPFSNSVHLKRPTSPQVQTLRKNPDSIIAGRAVLNLVVEHREARAHGLWEMDQIAARRTAR